MKTNWLALRNGCLILASLACNTALLLAQSQAPNSETANAAVISSVAVTQGTQRASVRVEGEGRLEARAARMQNPDRLVLDFAGTRMAVQRTVIAGVAAPVRDVRLGQFRPDVARIVIDLTGVAPYQIGRDGNALVISVDAATEVPVDNGLTATTASNQESKAIHYGVAAPRGSSRHQATLNNISAPRFALPSQLTSSAGAFGALSGGSQPARPEVTGEQDPAQQAGQQAVQLANGAAATVAPPPPPAGSQQAAQQASSAAATLAPSAQGGATTSAATSKYTGEPISVNLKEVDLRDFFRLIHEISGLNVVLEPSVRGSLTIVLDEVPWDQALDIVLQNNGLDKQLNGNVLRIATRDTLKKEAETVRDLEKAQSDVIPPVTVTRELSYTKAASVRDTLKRFLSTHGHILADDRSNQLIIRDIPSVIPVLDNLIAQLDRKSKQVEIEARVVSASRSFAQDIGTELGFAGTTTSGRSLFSGSPAVGGSGGVSGGGIPAHPVNFPTG